MAQSENIKPVFNDAASWVTLDAGAYPLLKDTGKLVRPSIELDLGDTPAAHEHMNLIETALLILSQSETGRTLLQAAKDADYLIIANPAVVGGAGAEHENDARASADALNRFINLRCNAEPLALAFRIAHELAHVTQFNQGLELDILGPHPVSALRQLLAMEADARAFEMKVAIDLATVKAGEPANRMVFPDALDVAAESIGNSFGKAIVERIRPKLEDGTLKPETAMLATFRSFYQSISLRAHYEATILNGLGQKTESELQDPKNFQQWRDADDIIRRLDARGIAYHAAAPAGYIDLDSPMMASAHPRTLDALKAFEKVRHENPATRADRAWELESYVIKKAPAPVNGNAPKP